MIRLRHIGITVKDIERSLRFYRDLLDFKIIWDKNESGDYIDNFSAIKNINVRTVKMIDDQNNTIELLQYYSHPSSDSICQARLITSIGCSHFALTVSHLDELQDKLSKEGIRFKSDPQYSPDGNAKITFCQDPDGVLIELVEIIK